MTPSRKTARYIVVYFSESRFPDPRLLAIAKKGGIFRHLRRSLPYIIKSPEACGKGQDTLLDAGKSATSFPNEIPSVKGGSLRRIVCLSVYLLADKATFFSSAFA